MYVKLVTLCLCTYRKFLWGEEEVHYRKCRLARRWCVSERFVQPLRVEGEAD